MVAEGRLEALPPARTRRAAGDRVMNVALRRLAVDSPDVQPLADVCAAFELRSWARAYLWAIGEFSDLPRAIDPLQAAAVESGLVEQLGQDRVQVILASAFAAVRDEIQTDTPITLKSPDPVEGAAALTVATLMYSLRERGEAALSEPNSLKRLAQLSTLQVRGVIARLITLRPRYPAITDDLLFILGEQLS
jgi:hypothetical protein